MIEKLADHKTPTNTWADAFDAAIAAMPVRDYAWFGIGIHGALGGVLEFPAETIEIDRTLEIPRDRNVAVRGPGPNGCVLRYTAVDGAPLFAVGTGGDCYTVGSISDLVCVGGRIEFPNRSNRLWSIDRCVFYDIDEHAIQTNAQSVIEKRVRDCIFVNTAGGIDISDQACDLWSIETCTFVRLSDSAVKCNRPGSRLNWITRCDFELATPGVFAWIHCNEGEFLRVTNNRFGGEVDAAGHTPPKYAIAIGPQDGGAIGTLGGYQIAQNIFFGRNGGATDSSAASAVYLGKAIKESVISDNQFKAHHGALIHEDFDANNGARDNSFIGNVVDSNNHRGGVFSASGAGFF